MKLDAVQSAAQAKLEAEMKPVTDRLSRLRATLDAYEAVLRVDIERRVNNTILVALGQEALPELDDLELARSALRDAMSEMSGTIELAPSTPAAPPEPPQAAPAEPTFATLLAHGSAAMPY